MKKFCAYCKKEFETKKGRECCSRSHAAYLQAERLKSNPEKYNKRRERLSKSIKKSWQDPKRKIIQTKRIKEVLSDPEVKDRLKKGCKIAQNRQETKDKIKNKLIEYFKSGKNKKERSDKAKKSWENIEIRKKRIMGLIAFQNRKDIREKSSYRRLKFWRDVENAEKVFISKYKNYILPSGTIVKIQGYENKALDLLLKKYSESDLYIGVKNIHKILGRIAYYHKGKKRTYWPDIFIKSENKIIEVKSKWTYKKHIIINKLKRKACLNLGFKFKFMIF